MSLGFHKHQTTNRRDEVRSPLVNNKRVLMNRAHRNQLTDVVWQVFSEVLETGPDLELSVYGLQFVRAWAEVAVKPEYRLGPQ